MARSGNQLDGPSPRMNAEPLLNTIAKALADRRLETVMVGNAAAALHGAPVTTLDVDFMFPKMPTNLRKLKAVALDLQAVILKPYTPRPTSTG